MAAKKEKKVAVIDRKAEIEKELRVLVKGRNDALAFNEYSEIAKIDEAIEKAEDEYATEAENDCFNILKKAENPMVEAAKTMTYTVARVREVKIKEGEKKGSPETVLDFVPRGIDPLRLHNKTPDGIGADKGWMYKVERLNMLFTAKSALDLEKDPQKIKNTISMSEEAKKVALSNEDASQGDDVLLANVQSVITAMLGDGYTATRKMVEFLKKVHSKGGRNNLSVVCSTHKGMRGYMLGVCHAAVTGDDFDLVYKEAKK